MNQQERSLNRGAIIEDAKDLARRRGKTIAELLTKPDREVCTLLSRASEAGATYAIEQLASAER
jgi:hypothetical protein